MTTAEPEDVLYPALIEHSLDLVATLDEHGTILFQSPSARRILGYDPSELVGCNAFGLVHPDDLGRVKDAFALAWQRPGPTPFVEHRFRHKNGSWRSLESVGSAITTPDGRRIGIVNSRDITDHRALQEQLRHAQRVATLGRMASSLVHEFHNALQVIRLSVDAMLDSSPQSPFAPDLEGMKRSADLAALLARQMLVLSRTGHSAPQPLDIHDGVAAITPILQRLVGRGIVLETRLRAQQSTVLARVGAIDQILINLVSNARDAVRAGGVIAIETCNVGGSVVLEVSDDGVGIPLEIQERIFEPFFTTKAASQGTGLGLSTVRDIVGEARGSIDVSSAPGRGATFILSLPVAESPEAKVLRSARWDGR